MKADDIVQLLILLRAGNVSISDDGKWVRSSCPKASYFHESGTDSHPSFGVRVNDGGFSTVCCFTCGNSTLAGLIHALTWTVGISPKAHEWFLHKEFLLEESSSEQFFVDYKDCFSANCVAPASIAVPPYVLAEYPLLCKTPQTYRYEHGRVRDWLYHRNISVDMAIEYQTRISPHDRAIVFPIVDTDGLTYLLHARSRVNKRFFYLNPVNSGYPELIWGRKDFWFGIQHVDMSEPIILVESETDLLRLRTLGVENVLASCGPVGAYKLNRVSAPKTYLGFDSDLKGAKYCVKTLYQLHSSSALYRLNWSVLGLKDAGDLQSRDEFDEVWKRRKAVYLEGNQLMIDPVFDEVPKYVDKYAMAI